jgi:HAD superfamily phosphatase (TIGR01668 family)
VLELGAGRLRSLGLDALLLDMDCTLKDHGAREFRPEVIDWLGGLRSAGVRLCVLSNGRPNRIAALSGALELPYVAAAFKPLPVGCLRAIRKLGLDASTTAVVGDQVFADVLAGRLAGLFTILVEPTSSEEPWFTRLKRPLERLVLRRLAPHPGSWGHPPLGDEEIAE